MRKSQQSLLRISSILFSTNFVHNNVEKKYYTEEDVSNHNTPNDAWVSYKNKVYDINYCSNPIYKTIVLIILVGILIYFIWFVSRKQYTDELKISELVSTPFIKQNN